MNVAERLAVALYFRFKESSLFKANIAWRLMTSLSLETNILRLYIKQSVKR